MAKTKKEISWEAPEFISYQKSAGWYVGMTILGLALLAFALWQKDILMLITFGALIFAAYAYSHKEPKSLKIKLTGKGVSLNRDEYPYNSLKSFWIIYDPPEVKTLTLETSQYINKELVLQLENVDPSEIRAFLEQYLPENFDKEEAYSDRLMRKLRF